MDGSVKLMGARRVLVFRLGSIGDFVVALPALHLIRRAFPLAEVRLLTSKPVDQREVSARSVLEGTGLVDGYLAYTAGTRELREFRQIRAAIREFAPDLFIYLNGARDALRTYRDYAFFRGCGVKASIGFPLSRKERGHEFDAKTGLWEAEARQLARRVAALGDAAPERRASWDLHLSPAEFAEADAALHAAFGETGVPDGTLVALSIGAKLAVKDWGDDNWRAVLKAVSRPDMALILIGAAAESERSASLARDWAGPVANLCGRTSPRISAAAMRRARLFLGHDSGPMHLAAAVGTQCVVVFGRNNRPGEWFPFGNDHRVLYPPREASSIRAIQPAEMIAAIEGVLRNPKPAVARELT